LYLSIRLFGLEYWGKYVVTMSSSKNHVVEVVGVSKSYISGKEKSRYLKTLASK
jgi:hypothetical protein